MNELSIPTLIEERDRLGRFLDGTRGSEWASWLKTHGDAKRGHKTRLYRIWTNMKNRCSSANNKSFKDYGAKGIKVCKEWSVSYSTFRAWAIKSGYSDSLTIDRIDNVRGYEPSNCRWLTIQEQQKHKSSNRPITFCGRTQNMSDWAHELGLAPGTLWARIFRYGWPLEKALNSRLIPQKERPWKKN